MNKSKAQYKALAFESSQNGHDRYTRIYSSMFESVAWKSLSHASRTVYFELKSQYRGNYTGTTIKCPYSVFIQKYGMNSNTVSKALSELEAKGFIKIERGTKQCKNTSLHRQPNEYTFSSDWKKFNNSS